MKTPRKVSATDAPSHTAALPLRTQVTGTFPLPTDTYGPCPHTPAPAHTPVHAHVKASLEEPSMRGLS